LFCSRQPAAGRFLDGNDQQAFSAHHFGAVVVRRRFSQSAPTRIRLAVMNFSPPSGAADRGYDDSSRKFWGDPGRMMLELLTTHLVKSGRFDVVERARFYQLLNEQKISTDLAMLGDQAKRIGAELGAQAIIVGSYQPSPTGMKFRHE
jgi:hypothetical protein